MPRDPYRRRPQVKPDPPLSPHALKPREAYLASLGPRRLALELAAIVAGPVPVQALRDDAAARYALGAAVAGVLLRNSVEKE